LKDGEKPIVNPYVLLREEFDDWAVLFDPDRGRGFGLSPTGVYVWKLLDGEHTVDDLLRGVRVHATGVPEEARDHIGAFVDQLVAEGLVGFNSTRSDPHNGTVHGKNVSPLPLRRGPSGKPFAYELPRLVDLGGARYAARGDCVSGSQDSGACNAGGGAGSNCWDGGSPSYQCLSGNSAPSNRCCTGTGPGWASACWAGNCPISCSGCYGGIEAYCQNGNAAD